MGRGDKKTKKGKISKGSFGVSRKRNTIKAKLKKMAPKKESGPVSAEVEAPAKPKRTAAKKKSEA